MGRTYNDKGSSKGTINQQINVSMLVDIIMTGRFVVMVCPP